jgi:hypothetical protein
MVSRQQVLNMLQRNAAQNDMLGSTNGAGYIGGGYIGGVCNNCMQGGCMGCMGMAGNGYIGGTTMGGTTMGGTMMGGKRKKRAVHHEMGSGYIGGFAGERSGKFAMSNFKHPGISLAAARQARKHAILTHLQDLEADGHPHELMQYMNRVSHSKKLASERHRLHGKFVKPKAKKVKAKKAKGKCAGVPKPLKAWCLFRQKHAGKGYSPAQLSQMYHESK